MLPLGITMALSTFSITFYNKNNFNNNLVNSLLNLNILFTFTYFLLLFFNVDQIIFYFLGDKFQDMLIPLVIYSYILPIKSINIFILSSVMIKEGKYILVSKLIYTALILNILANFFLIPKFELYGAIYSSIISEIYLFLFILYFNNEKFLQNKYFNLTMLVILQFILIFSVNLLFEDEKILKLIFSCIIGSPIILVYYFMFRGKKIAL
jgi:O-antigen/teichoic acid export membrane protein